MRVTWSRRSTWVGVAAASLVLGAGGYFSPAGAALDPSASSTRCAAEGEYCSFSGTRTVQYGGDGRFVTKSLTDGTPCSNAVFGDPDYGVVKSCELLAATPDTPTPTPTQAQFEAAIGFDFDFEGENGKLQSDPARVSVGYPCGVPNSYSWKFGTSGLDDVARGVGGRGPQLAGAGYNQVYNACGSRQSVPNARIEFTNLVVQYLSKTSNTWVIAVKQPVGGAAFAEDFVNNQATGADIRDEPQGYRSVRSGIGNASGDAGSSTGRVVQDGAVGFNFHGFPDRFAIDWADVKAIVAAQSMRCIPQGGADLSDCNKLGYIANVGLDSWAATTSSFDGFKTHGGVSGGRMKAVTTTWQAFTNYVGPRDFTGITPPPAPQY